MQHLFSETKQQHSHANEPWLALVPPAREHPQKARPCSLPFRETLSWSPVRALLQSSGRLSEQPLGFASVLVFKYTPSYITPFCVCPHAIYGTMAFGCPALSPPCPSFQNSSPAPHSHQVALVCLPNTLRPHPRPCNWSKDPQWPEPGGSESGPF